MDKQNVTIALPKALVREAKVLAAKRGTSISALLADALAAVVRKESEYDRAKRRILARAKRGFDLGTRGRATWTREELHERRP